MRYLLDVNALVALGVERHLFHERVALWLRGDSRSQTPEMATCAITELGFVRVLGQARQHGFSVSQAKELLSRLKARDDFHCAFISDDHDASRLPSWASNPGQTTDGHLLELAKAKGSILATLDARIPGAFLIPPEG